jgi:hypothetical protein
MELWICFVSDFLVLRKDIAPLWSPVLEKGVMLRVVP